METITWAIHLPDGLSTSNFLEKICDPCATCNTNKNEIRDWFYLEMKKMITFRGHGSLYNSGNNRYHNSHNFNRIGRFNSKIGLEDDSIEWEAFEDDEILTLLKLIGFGITKFNFTIKSDSEIDVEYEGYQLKTQFMKLMRDR
ncbi:Oidioi.mRNA.OKI2018_I69.chr1.g3130.t1.cds [Oikopleura dioica]|uniref:Oidioi.mRNA.OKI2018_I69.chr1.g3130.t1.cds n=1 Tax=Oikopleura dioica TaxID=34765 RepID=A0ABN7SUY8_OIKDI|nr:Oidioi.mRNA.OKI2018_I69.chr1.g3130.t1.cds [Oikopleura dioica]